jgi:predicted dienelactone hydrolase
MVGESVFFEGTPSIRNAAIGAPRYPIILLSHGAGLAGSPDAMSWIAARLAAHGFVVAAPRHPGNSGPDRSAAETMKIWLRPADLSATLDAVAGDPFFKDHVDTDHVGALGLSMGGTTALAIAGAHIDTALLSSYCDDDSLNASLCDWVRQSGVDLHAMNFQSAERTYRDGRVRFAMAIDPAPVDVLDGKSLAAISIPVSIVNLGKAGEIPKTADASALATVIPKARYETIADASHYSLFAECKPGAAQHAQAAGIDDPLCADGGGRSRRAIHEQLVQMAITTFDRMLKPDGQDQ